MDQRNGTRERREKTFYEVPAVQEALLWAFKSILCGLIVKLRFRKFLILGPTEAVDGITVLGSDELPVLSLGV